MADEAIPSAIPDDAVLRARPFVARFRMYLAERYPIVPGIVLAVLFGGTCDLVAQGEGIASIQASASGLAAEELERLSKITIDMRTVAICALVFLIFLLLRVLDEFKDFDDDKLAHPERVVQRGIVTLGELRGVRTGIVGVMLAIAAMLGGMSLLAWLAAIVYAGLMAREFFIGAVLRKSMLAYALSHQVVVPLVAFACIVTRIGRWPDHEVFIELMWVTACLGFGFEVGRKINAPEEEDPHDESYSRAWGAKTASGVAVVALLIPAIVVTDEHFIGLPRWSPAIVFVGWLLATLSFIAFLRAPSPKTSKRLQGAAALVSLFTYGGLIAGIIACHGLRFGS